MKFRTNPVEIKYYDVTLSKQYEKFKSKDYANFFPEFEKLSSDFIELFERMYNEDEQKRATLKEIETLKWVCEGAIPTDQEIQDEIKKIKLFNEKAEKKLFKCM